MLFHKKTIVFLKYIGQNCTQVAAQGGDHMERAALVRQSAKIVFFIRRNASDYLEQISRQTRRNLSRRIICVNS